MFYNILTMRPNLTTLLFCLGPHNILPEATFIIWMRDALEKVKYCGFGLPVFTAITPPPGEPPYRFLTADEQRMALGPFDVHAFSRY